MVWKITRTRIQLIIYVCRRLCKNIVLHRHMSIVFLPNPAIAAILELPFYYNAAIG